MIKKTPWPDHPDPLVRQRARYLGRLPERDSASRQQQFFRPSVESTGAQILLRPRIKITQVPTGLSDCPRLVRLSALD